MPESNRLPRCSLKRCLSKTLAIVGLSTVKTRPPMVILWAVRVRRGPNSLLAGYSSGRGIGIGGGSRTLSNMGLSHARLPVAPRRCSGASHRNRTGRTRFMGAVPHPGWLGWRWKRGWDLNPRSSGYEPNEDNRTPLPRAIAGASSEPRTRCPPGKNRMLVRMSFGGGLERATGLEPVSPHWQRGTLPLSYALIWSERQGSNPRDPVPKTGGRPLAHTPVCWCR